MSYANCGAYKAWSPEKVFRLKEEASLGKSASEIAAVLECPRGSVCYMAKKHHIKLRGGKRWKNVNKRFR